MKKVLAGVLTVLVMIIFLTPAAAAHSPLFAEGNNSQGDAYQINDPEKSWVLYGELHDGEKDYYKMDMKEGQIIYIKIIVPPEYAESDFLPELKLNGPGMKEITADEVHSSAEYEPFTPSASYTAAEIEIAAPQDGTYYVTVFDDDKNGNYGLTIGKRESFTLYDWLTIPFASINIYQWEGQSIWIVLAPGAIAFLAGLAIMMTRKGPKKNLLYIMSSIGGLLIIASGISFLYQMIFSITQSGLSSTALVSLIFVLIPIVLGILAIRTAEKKFQKRTRVYLLIIGIASLFLWGGWLIGPAALIIAALMPKKWLLKEP